MNKFIRKLKSPIVRIILSSILFLAAIVTEHLSLGTISVILYLLSLVVAGLNVFINAVRGIIRRDLLDERFLMSIASIGAVIVGEWSEGVAVMLFYLIGETFEHYAVRKSRNSIRALMDIIPDEATVLLFGNEIRMETDEVEIGSTVIIRPGERVGLDCRVISGRADVDTSALTGEPLPRSVLEGDALDSGSVVLDGTLICETLRTAEDSGASRILALVSEASENKAREESFITVFSRYYTPIVVSLGLLLAVIPPIFGWLTLADSVYRALIMLVISCPCALVISVPMAFFGGIGGGASNGILFKGGNVFSSLARANCFAFDKTGTLTSGRFTVSTCNPVGIDESELINIAASAEWGSNHPIAQSLKDSATAHTIPMSTRELAGEGVVAEIEGHTVAVGNNTLMRRLGVKVDFENHGVLVSRDGVFIGEIIIGDTVKSEAKSALSTLRELGVSSLVMISGDKRENADRVASEVGIDRVYAEMTPEQKYSSLEGLITARQGSVAYVGDGINDAPSLALADIGIAMGGVGQDSAIEAADVVITNDDLSKLPRAVLLARKTVSIVKFNIAFAIGIKLLILILGALNIANMWLAVFADVGVAVIAILNSMRALRAPKLRRGK